MSLPELVNNRILIIDDNAAIHEDFRKILPGPQLAPSPLMEMEKLLYGTAKAAVSGPTYVVDSAYQGLEGLEMIRRASQENKPYALAFVDVRIPPGLDGIQTIKAIWKEHPELQVAICTAFSDYSWEDMLQSLGSTDNLLILKKPFDTIEARQIACALTAKWNLNRERQQAEKEQRRLSEELKGKNLALQDDIVARKKMEVELVAARETSDKAHIAALEASVAKSAFLANMSHEIRTPMNAIIGFNYLMSQTVMTIRQSDYTAKSGIAAKSLLGLINDILDLSKVEAGKIELEQIPFNLDEVFSKLLQVTSLLAQQKHLEFEVHIAPSVPLLLIGDPLRLEQVLLNLVTNAIKFTEAGAVTIFVELIERANSSVRLRFRVRDSGIGMHPAQLLKLFQPFVQADSSTTRKHGGTGLGLAISKQFVKLMQGEIEVESKPGQGSTFSFTARLGESPNIGTQIKSESVSHNKPRALVIDGNAESRIMLSKMLIDLHFDVTTCATGREALLEIARQEHVVQNSFDLLLIDCSETGKDWLSDVFRIREGFSGGVLPKIILIADESMADQKLEFSGLGINDIVFKPLTGSAIFDAISRAQARHIRRIQSAKGTPVSGNVLQGARVLLVEDEEINQQIAAELLEMVGCEIIIAPNGADAVTMITGSLADDEFDAVLMDLHMPGMDGLAATRQIRAKKRFANLPIIAMTADAIQGVQERCLAAGMNDYLTKPFNPEEVFATLGRWILMKAKSARPDK